MPPARDSHSETRATYDSVRLATAYSTKFVGTGKDAREQRCIANALSGLPADSLVLDLPCGAGRMTPFLVGLGYKVVAADSSIDMVRLARERCLERFGEQEVERRVRFLTEDILTTSFPDGAFDAVLCNRLLHHFDSAALRRSALSELARVCSGPVVVSFFSSRALDAIWLRVRESLRAQQPQHRYPVSPAEFIADIEASGLEAASVVGVRPGISPQTYVKAVPARTSVA